jgi:hypothetical protein
MIPHHHRPRPVPARQGDGSQQVPRIGLSHREAVAAADHREQGRHTQRREQRPGRRDRLVGADRQRPAGRQRLIEHRAHAGKQHRRPGRVGFVVRQIVAHRRGIRRRVSAGQRAFHQDRDPIADHRPDLRAGQRRQEAGRQHPVRRRAQILDRVHQRTIEIEHQQGHAVFRNAC